MRVPADLHDWLQKQAEARMVSVNYLARRALEQLRDSMPEVAA